MICREVSRAVDPYVDGELEPSHVLEVERHLQACDTCSARASLRRSMKRSVRLAAQADRAPTSLRARIARSSRALAATEAARARPTGLRAALPWAAAAAVAIGVGGGIRAMGAMGQGNGSSGSSGSIAGSNVEANVMSANASHAMLLDEFASYHARPLPPEELDPVRVNTVFSPIVGVPVHPSSVTAGFEGFQAISSSGMSGYTFAGARLMRVHNEAAATLSYTFGGSRVTVFVFDPQRIQIKSACCLTPHLVNAHGQERLILMGRAKGYPLAAFERDGVGYAVSGDITESQVTEIATKL